MSKIVCFYILCLFSLLHNVAATAEKSKLKSTDQDSADSWKKKDIRDYSEADLERLYEQWEEGDEELEPDELPEWKREAPAVDFSKYDSNKPEELLMMSKKGKTLMMFVSVSGDPARHETEEITSLWQSSLYNANIDITRYLISDNRAIFMLKDGSKAWEIKNFLVEQERCLSVTIENQDFPGKGSPKKTEL
ncbi:Hypothetical predicted protein [Octopus vulgaris]|uniref:Uncharacterized protein n=2 Tax=Octopus TaxID=6643 RepID=A0AA36BGI3_OCTVU|nr:LDLR chaperone boca [Octopus sinensis]CAI9733181.1 Hypothetical predicted protein [Octopus vulgaris]